MPDDTKNLILIVEDDPFLRNLLSTRLAREGFKIDIAIDGVEAGEKIRSIRPALILLDLILPRKNGFEVLEEISDDPQLRSIPIIIISNLGQESDIQRGKSLGAMDYFVKARLSIDELVSKIKEIVPSASTY
jgi:DNA-binding response OmpR family regulator